jgi:hypothetical protein
MDGSRSALRVRAQQWATRIALASTIAVAGRARAAEERQVLQSFPAPPYTYQLSLDACPKPPREDGSGGACTFGVRLLKEGKVVSSQKLYQPACGPPARPTSSSVELGADLDAKAWGTDDEKCDIRVAARTVTLGPKATGLMVTQLQGFEYPYRSHVLYLPINDDLVPVWRHDEPEGGEWSMTSVLPAGDDANYVELVVVQRDDRGRASNVRAEQVRQDEVTRQIVSTPLPYIGPLYVLYVGRFKSPSDAWKHAFGSCLEDLQVMRAGLFPNLRLPPFFMGAVFARQDDAKAALAKFATCPEAKGVSGVLADRGAERTTKGKSKRSADGGPH